MAKIKATAKSKGYFAIDSESKAHLLAHTNKHIHTHAHTNIHNIHIQNRIYVNNFEIFYSLSIKTYVFVDKVYSSRISVQIFVIFAKGSLKFINNFLKLA